VPDRARGQPWVSHGEREALLSAETTELAAAFRGLSAGERDDSYRDQGMVGRSEHRAVRAGSELGRE
jgi:hypothetical protein